MTCAIALLKAYDMELNLWHMIHCLSGAPPSPRHSHSAVKWRDCMYIFGGYDGK